MSPSDCCVEDLRMETVSKWEWLGKRLGNAFGYASPASRAPTTRPCHGIDSRGAYNERQPLTVYPLIFSGSRYEIDSWNSESAFRARGKKNGQEEIKNQQIRYDVKMITIKLTTNSSSLPTRPICNKFVLPTKLIPIQLLRVSFPPSFASIVRRRLSFKFK